MSHEEIEITIDANGRVTVRTIGIKGARCLEVAESIAKILGREESRTLTSEFYEAESKVSNSAKISQRRIP